MHRGRVLSKALLLGVVILAGVVAATASCRRGAADANVEPMQSPAGPNSGQPQLTVSARGVLLSWIEQDGRTASLKFAERTPSGWSQVRTVASGDDWFINAADVPSVMRLTDGAFVAHWLQQTDPAAEAYDLRLSYSSDEAQTWATSFTPHHDGTKTQHGFASLFEMPGAGLGLVWLDGRAMQPDQEHSEHGSMSLRLATFDRDWKQTSEALLDPRVCECCPTTAAATAAGVITAFRDRSSDEIRDIAVVRLENGNWSEPTSVYEDDWQISACPVNGPAMSARGREIAIAWFTVKNAQGQTYAALSHDAGRSWGTAIRLDENGSLGRVGIAMLEDGSAAATWVEIADQRAQFRMRRVDPSGVTGPALNIASGTGGRLSGYPRVAARGDELVFAWTERVPTDASGVAGPARVQTAAVRVRH